MINDLFDKNIEILSSALIHPGHKLHHLMFIEMTEEESKVFADKAMDELTDDLLADTLLYLALFTNGHCLTSHYRSLISRNIFYPCEIYIHADSGTAQNLIEVIERPSSEVSVNHILICLAWIGTPNVIDFFLRSAISKPTWTKDLYVSPIEYAEQAGWIIDASNKKRYLLDDQEILSLIKSDQLSNIGEVKTFLHHKDSCKWCNNSLSTVFKISEKEFTTCLFCSCYGDFFMKLNDNGQSFWRKVTRVFRCAALSFCLAGLREGMLANVLPRMVLNTSASPSFPRKPLTTTLDVMVAIS